MERANMAGIITSDKSHIGKIYGNLKVVGIGSKDIHNKRFLVVTCLKHPHLPPHPVRKTFLVSGRNTMCKECVREISVTHGMWDTTEYRTWKNMLNRIHNPEDINYHNYGGRGIRMDPRYHPDYNNQGYEKAFLNFFKDIGKIPNGLTIDRIDNDRGYWKDNIKFSTPAEQIQNSRKAKLDADTVKTIREEIKSSSVSILYKKYKHLLSLSGFKKIVYGYTWKNI